MIIKGNTVGTPMPRTDWNQTDPTKADYLKGRDKILKLIQDVQDNVDGLTYSEVGAAPDGHGLGGIAAGVADFNDATLTGWYFGNTGTANKPFGYSLVHVINRNNTEVLQIGYDMANPVSGYYQAWTTQVRRKVNGEWYEWEYENPPMTLGVEYRTTERYNGSVVYTKLVDCGNLVNNTTKNVVFAEKPVAAISVTLRSPNANIIAPYWSGNGSIRVGCSENYIRIECVGDFTAAVGHAAVKYIK